MSELFVIVNKNADTHPFWNAKSGKWVADRDDATRYSEAEVVRALPPLQVSFGSAIVADHEKHPEVEAAILKCCQGDSSELLVLKDYEMKAGWCSLRFFAAKVLFGRTVVVGGGHGHFRQLFQHWGG